MDFPENTSGTPVPNYEEWLAHGRELSEKHSGYQWNLGDWLCEGQDHFDVGPIDGYLLLHKTTRDDGTNGFRGERVPNFWSDVSEEIGLSPATLKDYAWVARSYPKEKRVKQLGFCHHLIVAAYDKRFEYLAACMEGARPRSVEWLRRYAQAQEGTATSTNATKEGGPLHLVVPPKYWAKLQDLRRYYNCAIADLVEKACVGAIEDYIEEQGRKISLEVLEFYEGRWPFEVIAEKKSNRKRRNRRRMNDPVFSEKMRQVNIARHSKLGRVA